MIKNLLLATLVVQSVSAQIISRDNTFATNGIHSITSNYASSKMLQVSNGDIYYTFDKNNGAPTATSISRLASNGSLDMAFGNNGEIQLPYGSHDSKLKLQPDGKLLFYTFDSNSNEAAIIRMLPNGQLDNTFGVSGVAKVANLNVDFNLKGYDLILQNNKIIVYGQEPVTDPLQNPPERIYRLNENGSVDTTFGNNGFITHSGTLDLVETDTQSNIVCFGLSKDNGNYVGTTTKYTHDGQPLSGFGNNGAVYLTFNTGSIQSIILDNNNNIIFSRFDPNAAGSLNKVNADGSFDGSFVANFNSTFSFPVDMFSIIEKDGYYYLGGMYYGQNYPSFFISRAKQTGQMDSTFNYFTETSQELASIGDMIVNDNNIIANGSNRIVKYLLNNPTLATIESTSASTIAFENPVSQNLIYTTKDKVAKIEIFSTTGKLMKTTKDSNTPVSDLPNGVYMAKITFENGNSTTKKLIKN
ncbi:T9SS type A sorting domain-containing protein [Chryseobacterium sp. M5A1_1a]